MLGWLCAMVLAPLPSALDFRPCLGTTSSGPTSERPLTVAAGNWDAPHILGRIAQIILNEGIGIRADFRNDFGGSGSVIAAVIGCVDTACTSVLEYPEAHMDFEYWFTEAGDRLAWKHRSRIVQGFIGYDGQEGLYMRDSIAQRIWDEHQVPIEYFVSLNNAGRPWLPYFTKPTNITVPPDSGCRGAAAEVMAAEGMPCDADGWYYSPACAGDKDSCIPVMLGGVGWLGLESCRVVKYNSLPMAVTFLAWPDQRIIDGSVDAMFFWWRPDWTYNSLGPVRRLILPKHNRQEWAQDIHRTDFPDFQLKKLMWAGVEGVSYKAARMFDNFEFSWSQINRFMADMHARRGDGDPDLKETIACEWARANEEIWRAWFPVIAPCAAGSGVIGDTCAECPAATLSVFDNTTSNLVCGPCPEGAYCEGGAALPCPAGYYCPLNSSAPTPCPVGHQHAFFRGASLDDCTRCPVGTFSPSPGSPSCTNCSAGRYQDDVAGTHCVLCSLGEEQPLPGQTACSACPNGTFAADPATSLCSACPRGFFAGEGGSTACSACPVGTYAGAIGSISCSRCPAPLKTFGLGTVSAEGCNCPVGSYYVNSTGASSCVPCGEGLVCAGDLSVAGDRLPELLPGYMIYPALQRARPLPDHITTFRCIKPEFCPGGPDIWSQEGICGTRVGIACDLCPPLHYSQGSVCRLCGGTVWGAWLAAVAISPLVALYMYRKLNRENPDQADVDDRTARLSSNPMLTRIMRLSHIHFLQACRDELYIIARDTFKLLLDFVQTLGVFGGAFLNAPALVRAVVNVGKISNFEVDTVVGGVDQFGFKVSCMIGSSFLQEYALALSIPVWVALTFSFNLLVLPRVSGWLRPKLANTRNRCVCLPSIRVTADKTINALGNQMCALFIGVTSMSLSLFVTYSHPGGERSVRRYPSVLWGDESWYTALPLGILSFLVYTVFVIAGAIWVCIRAPRFAHIRAFRVRYYFLLDGYRPTSWYWGTLLLVKALIINLIFVIYDTTEIIAIASLIVIVFFLCLKFIVKPWPNQTMNIADTTYSIALCLIIPAMYMRTLSIPTPEEIVSVNKIEEFAVLAPVFVTVLCIGYSIHTFLHKSERAVSRLRSAKRLQNIIIYSSKLSVVEFNEFVKDLDDESQTAMWRAMYIMYAGLMKWQGGPSLRKQGLIIDAEEFQLMSDAEMLRLLEETDRAERVNICLHERVLLQHLSEALMRSYVQSAGQDVLRQGTRVTYDQVFDMLDADGNGTLSKDEFVSATVQLCYEVTREEATTVFEVVDFDRDGAVTRQEFHESLRGICVDPFDLGATGERRATWRAATLVPTMVLDVGALLGRRSRADRAARQIQRVFRGRHANDGVTPCGDAWSI